MKGSCAFFFWFQLKAPLGSLWLNSTEIRKVDQFMKVVNFSRFIGFTITKNDGHAKQHLEDFTFSCKFNHLVIHWTSIQNVGMLLANGQQISSLVLALRRTCSISSQIFNVLLSSLKHLTEKVVKFTQLDSRLLDSSRFCHKPTTIPSLPHKIILLHRG